MSWLFWYYFDGSILWAISFFQLVGCWPDVIDGFKYKLKHEKPFSISSKVKRTTNLLHVWEMTWLMFQFWFDENDIYNWFVFSVTWKWFWLKTHFWWNIIIFENEWLNIEKIIASWNNKAHIIKLNNWRKTST